MNSECSQGVSYLNHSNPLCSTQDHTKSYRPLWALIFKEHWVLHGLNLTYYSGRNDLTRRNILTMWDPGKRWQFGSCIIHTHFNTYELLTRSSSTGNPSGEELIRIFTSMIIQVYVCRMSRNFFRGITVPGSWVVNLHITIVGTSHLIRMRTPRKPISTFGKRFKLSWENLSW